MDNILYKKNIPILRYKETNGFIEVIQVYNKHHLPVHLYINGKPDSTNLYALNEKLEQFLDNRLIPSTRQNIKETLKELEIESNYELAKKSWFLSLSDQYWICPIDQRDKLFWEDINFFTNNYDSAIGLRLVSSTKSLNKYSSSYSPDNTTNGELPKRWFKKDGIDYLEKAGSGTEQQEPLNEILASEICKRLNIPYVQYTLLIRDEKYYCYCPDMVDEDSEMIPLDSVYQDIPLIDFTLYDYQTLINRCNQLGIPDAECGILKILLLDYIMANVDRHSYNISFIRDSNTLLWKGIAPVYDTGKSMFINQLDFEIDMMTSSNIEAKPFYPTQKQQIDQLPFYKIKDQIDLFLLNDIDKWYMDFLKPLKRISEQKKSSLVKKLKERIEEAKKILYADKEKSITLSVKQSNEELVYTVLCNNPESTKEQVSELTGLSRATITRVYKTLEEKQKIKRIGSNKTGYWQV